MEIWLGDFIIRRNYGCLWCTYVFSAPMSSARELVHLKHTKRNWKQDFLFLNLDTVFAYRNEDLLFKNMFLLTWFIVGFVVFVIYLYSGAFEYSTNSAFCRQSDASYMKKQYSKVLKLAAFYHPKLDGFNKIYLIRKLVKYKRANNQLKYWHGLKMKCLKV